MWFYSLCCTLYKSIYYLRLRNKSTHDVQELVNTLCQGLPILSPIICNENTRSGLPVTIPLSPKYCVISLPPVLVDQLTPNQLQLILAHELGHVTKHATKMWWAQALSCLSLNGAGYLTLLLNYWRMEV